MVNYQVALDHTFAALADPTRRAILARLGEEGNVSVSALAQRFPISLPAVMKHLDVLGEAGLVARRKIGRTVTCRLNAAPLESAAEWLNRYRQFWSQRLDRLAAFLEEDSCPPTPTSKSRSLRSSAASTRRRKRSSVRGRTPPS